MSDKISIQDLKALIREDPTIIVHLVDALVDLLASKDLITGEEKLELCKETVRRWYHGPTE